MSRSPVYTSGAPKPPSFLSQAIVLEKLVFCSGQIGCDPETGALIQGTIQERTKRIMSNLGAVLEAAGSSISDIVKINIYLTDMADFKSMNEAYEPFFSDLVP
ncbi:hypothetical protein VE02_09873, partial [Pseudogymnoascus sp. 03VT05]